MVGGWIMTFFKLYGKEDVSPQPVSGLLLWVVASRAWSARAPRRPAHPHLAPASCAGGGFRSPGWLFRVGWQAWQHAFHADGRGRKRGPSRRRTFLLPRVHPPHCRQEGLRSIRCCSLRGGCCSFLLIHGGGSDVVWVLALLRGHVHADHLLQARLSDPTEKPGHGSSATARTHSARPD